MTVLPANAEKIGVSRHLSSPHVLPLQVWPRAQNMLSQKCEDITEFDDNLGQLIMDMIYTMETLKGYGLAAPQVGVLNNIVVLSTPMQVQISSANGPTGTPEYENTIPRRHVLINPKLIATSEATMEMEEGCLSIPGYFETRKRPNEVVISYQDPRGTECTAELTYTEAFAFQHELDHLNGKLFIDELSPLKKNRIKKKIPKYMHLTTG